MKTKTLLLLLLIMALAVLTGCQPIQGPGSTLPGTSWALTSLDGALPLPGSTVTLNFGEDNTAAGSDGCNQYSTTYTISGSSISFGQPMAGTMMACPEPIMVQAAAYSQALAAADKVEINRNQLTLLNGRKAVATFVGVDQGLAGTAWQVLAYNNGREAVVSVLNGTDITALFDDSGQVTGNGGCNEYFASYQTSGNEIAIGAPGASRMACASPPGVMEQESEYLAALATAATFAVEGNKLEMRDSSGAIAVQMTRRFDVSPPAPAPGTPTGRVTAPKGVNIRSGPGTNYPVIGLAPFGAEAEIVGRSADGQWWAANIPAAPQGIGWASADFVAVQNAEDVPVIAASPPVYVPPAAPAPTAVPSPTAVPAPQMSFTASPTTIDQGQCATISWSVENVRAVWVYPLGQPYQQYPRAGQGQEQVCPPATTIYEMRVLLLDGTTVTQQVTVAVVPAAPENPLVGTAWQATGYNTGRGSVASPIVGTTITARFDAERVTGNTGCNDYFGPYYVSGSNIAFGSLGTGLSACDSPSGVMDQEAEYLAALQTAVSFRFDGNKLELRQANGAIAATYVRLQ